MDDSTFDSLRTRLLNLEKEVQALRHELVLIGKQRQADQGLNFGILIDDSSPYSLSAPAVQPDLVESEKPTESAEKLPSKPKASKDKPEPPVMSLAEAKNIVMDGYVLDHPGNADRLLKTLVFRALDGSVKGFKLSDLPAARIVARSMIENAGLRSTGQGFNDSRLRSLMRKYVPFEPITSIRRLPR
jgi:hypothetical protein